MDGERKCKRGFALPCGGRYYERGRKRPELSSDYRDALFLFVASGGYRLYGEGGVRDG